MYLPPSDQSTRERSKQERGQRRPQRQRRQRRQRPSAWLLLALCAAIPPLHAETASPRPTEPERASRAERAERAWQAKVDPWVLQTATRVIPTEFLVFLSEQEDLSGARHLPTKIAKGKFVASRLQATAKRSQQEILTVLENLEVDHRSFWIANMIWVRGDASLVQTMAQRSDVARILANPLVAADPSIPAIPVLNRGSIEWGVVRVGAPAYWAQGVQGEGIVVGGQDTGYDWDHPALVDAYRGSNGPGAVDHNYHWHDAIHSGGGVCGADSMVPCDDNNHGTHTMGTMVGDDGVGNQIGVAPGARWIGCRNMDQGNGTPATYSECFEWFVAPTDLAGNNPMPDMAPHVINNSWGCSPGEGCVDPIALLTVVQNVRAAGIVVVVSAGNSGAGCSSVNWPASIYDEVFTIGATDSGDGIASFSSRGPVTVDGSNRLKPDVSAPGVNVRSSRRGGGYTSLSGTSMAGPHVAGGIALLLSASPSLIGDVSALEECVTSTAVALTSAQDCGGVSGNTVPNNTFGYGRTELVWPLPPVCAGPAAIFADGFESGDVAEWN